MANASKSIVGCIGKFDQNISTRSTIYYASRRFDYSKFHSTESAIKIHLHVTFRSALSLHRADHICRISSVMDISTIGMSALVPRGDCEYFWTDCSLQQILDKLSRAAESMSSQTLPALKQPTQGRFSLHLAFLIVQRRQASFCFFPFDPSFILKKSIEVSL
jgi:hypothetical protein